MRRLVLIAMMFLLPFQLSWAAAASLCQHEADGAHFGHHAHPHHAEAHGVSAADASDHGAPAAPDFHPDCLACHGMGAVSAHTVVVGGPDVMADSHLSAYGRHVTEPPVEPFLRPPLSLVA